MIWPLTWLVQLAYYDLTFNVIGATMESPSQNPLACLYKPRVCGNKAELLRRNPCHIWLSLARWGAGLADSRLTSPRDPLALLREVPLPLSFCGAPPAETGVQRGARSGWTEEPGRLQSIGSQKVGHNWSNSARMDVVIYIIYIHMHIW